MSGWRFIRERVVKTRANHHCEQCGWGIAKGSTVISMVYATSREIVTIWFHNHDCT
jgi:hypothetical protein